MTIQELAKRYAEKPTDERYKALRDKIYEEEQPTNVPIEEYCDSCPYQPIESEDD